MRIRRLSKLTLAICLTACSNEAKTPEHPARAATGTTPAVPPAESTRGPPAIPTVACSPNQATAAGLACAVFHALKANDAPAFVRLFMLEGADRAAFSSFADHLPSGADDSRLADQRAAVERHFVELVGELRSRGVDPGTMELMEIHIGPTIVRGDLGFAEDLTLVILFGPKDMPDELEIKIDDCPFVRGRWLIMDSMRLPPVDREQDDPSDDAEQSAPARAVTSSMIVQGEVKVQGPLDKNIVRRIVRAHIPELRDCHELGLTRDPQLGGRVVVDFAVLATGKVSESTLRESTVPDAAVGQCMAAAIKRWTFPQPDRPATVTVSYPFELSPFGAPAASP